MERFCRTCLQSIPKDSLSFQLDGQDRSSVALLIKSQLQECVPEVRVGIIKNAVLCNSCLNDLTSAYKFKCKCLETEKQVLEYVLQADSNISDVDINLLIKRIVNNSKCTSNKNYDIQLKDEIYKSENVYNAKSKKGTQSVKKTFVKNEKKEEKNNLSNLLPSDIKIIGPFSEFISINDLNLSITDGIKKEMLKFAPFAIETVLRECVDINDSDIEEISEILLPSNKNDVYSVNNNEIKVKNALSSSEDIKIVENFQTVDPTNKNNIEILNVACDNTHISSNNKNKYSKEKYSKRSCTKNKKINRNTKNEKKISCIRSLTNSESIKGKELTTENNSVNEVNNKTIHLEDRTINKNVPVCDTSIVRNQLTELAEKDLTNEPIKEEYEPLVDLSVPTIHIKDEFIVKDEDEFQTYLNKFQEIQSTSLLESDDELFFIENVMEVDDFQSPNDRKASTSFICNDIFNSGPSYREARKGCYSCAVCNYSCNSESVLVTHTKMHSNKKVYEYYDDLVFCGFASDDIKYSSCACCKYIRTEPFLTWLTPEVVLTKYKPRLNKK